MQLQYFRDIDAWLTGCPSRGFVRTTLLAIAIMAGSSVLGAAAAPQANATFAAPMTRPIRVGASIDSYPYCFVDGSGRLTGFTVDLLDAVSRVMDLPIERELAPGLEINRRFAEGEFDVNQFFTVTPERRAYAQFSVPYLVVNGAIFTRTDDKRFAGIDDLRDKHAIVTTAGGPAHDFCRQHGITADQLRTVPTEEAIRQVADGRADAALISRLTGLAQIHRLKIKNVAPTGPQISQYPSQFCFAVRRDREQLLSELNEGLAVLHQTGEFDVIYRRWFSRFEPMGFTRNEVIAYVAAALALALVIALWAALRQRQLRHRVAEQAEELAESRALLAEAQAFAQLGHWQRLFERGEIAWSEEAFRVFGWDRHRGPPRSLEELLAWAGGPDIERWRDAIQRTEREHVPYDLDLTIEPSPGRRKTIHIRGRVVRAPDGKVVGLFGTVQDITARRAAELALQRSERLLRAFYENLPHAVGVVERLNDEWHVVSLNRGTVRMFALATVPPLPCPLGALKLAPVMEQQWRTWFAQCANATTPFKVNTRSQDGRRDLVATLVPLGPDVQPVQCYFLVEDITEQKEKDAEIAQGRRLRALGGLVGGIAHEFNNLLTPILITADQLHNEAAPNSSARAGLALISDTARRSAELTQRLLAFGRNRSREPERFDLAGLIENNLALLRQTSDRRIQIECVLPPDLPRLYLCANDVHQILLNLLLNARDTLVEKLAHSPDDWRPRLRIEAHRRAAGSMEPFVQWRAHPEAWVCLVVRDNGMGMPPGVLERVFEPFYTTKQVGRGTGLGLATVWHLVSELGGRVDVDSTPGEGSSFSVALPVFPAPAVNTSATPPAPTPPPQLRRQRVLIVDDEPVISQLVSSVLQQHGHTTTFVQHGHDAWERLARHAAGFDALIVDLNMPGLSGLEFARRARALPFSRPIIVMSGHVSEHDRLELERIGVTAILRKPFTADEFMQAFRAYVAAPTIDVAQSPAAAV